MMTRDKLYQKLQTYGEEHILAKLGTGFPAQAATMRREATANEIMAAFDALTAELAAARAEIARLRGDWIKCSDRLPEDDRNVMARHGAEAEECYHVNDTWFQYHSPWMSVDVFEWRPLREGE